MMIFIFLSIFIPILLLLFINIEYVKYLKYINDNNIKLKGILFEDTGGAIILGKFYFRPPFLINENYNDVQINTVILKHNKLVRVFRFIVLFIFLFSFSMLLYNLQSIKEGEKKEYYGVVAEYNETATGILEINFVNGGNLNLNANSLDKLNYQIKINDSILKPVNSHYVYVYRFNETNYEFVDSVYVEYIY
jgi:hypothetical protein